VTHQPAERRPAKGGSPQRVDLAIAGRVEAHLRQRVRRETGDDRTRPARRYLLTIPAVNTASYNVRELGVAGLTGWR
jgi:hypothetical protein